MEASSVARKGGGGGEAVVSKKSFGYRSSVRVAIVVVDVVVVVPRQFGSMFRMPRRIGQGGKGTGGLRKEGR